MQSQDVEEIKAALWEQAFLGCTQVRCPMGQVMAIRRREGQLLALIRGRGAGTSFQGCPLKGRCFAQPVPAISKTEQDEQSARREATLAPDQRLIFYKTRPLGR